MFRKVFSNFSIQENEKVQTIKHFLAIDVFRGIAAIVILIWHYQNFLWKPGTTETDGLIDVDRTIQPYYDSLMPIYTNGYWAVQAFWVISGFVFAYVYCNKKTKGIDFANARFSRLYPLHFITLIFITCLQSMSLKELGYYQMVNSNSAAGFSQHLLFISAWGFPSGGGFNGPIWSVSVEIAIYILFFFLARRLFIFGLLFPLFIVVVTWGMIHADGPVWNFALCAYFFFIGAILYYWLVKFNHNIFMMLVPIIISAGYFYYLIVNGFQNHMRFYDVSVFLFVSVVLAIGWLDFWRKTHVVLKPFKWVGDLTYSTYLWHFPIQVMILIIFAYFGFNQEMFTHKRAMVIWLIAMIIIGRLSFLYIEKPLQNYCRRKIKEAFND